MSEFPIKIEPELSECVMTKAKREYNALLKRALEGEDVGDRLEALRLFLENHDFAKLRAEYEKYLVEGKKVIFYIKRDGGYEMKVE